MIFLTLGVLALEALTLVLWQKDRSRFLHALISRTPVEFQRLEEKRPRQEPKREFVDSTEIPFGL